MDDSAIRAARPADAPRLAALSGVLGYPVAVEVRAERLERLAGRADQVVLVAEEVPGKVVSWIHGAEQDLLESERRCEILGLVVDDAHRARDPRAR